MTKLKNLKPLGLITFGVIYTIVIALGRRLSLTAELGPPLVWPAAGLYFGFLLLTPTRDWWKIALAVLFGRSLGMLWSGVPAPPNFYWGWVFNSFAQFASVLLLRRYSKRMDDDSPAKALLFVLIGGVVEPLLSSVFITILGNATQYTSLESVRYHFAGSSLGILTLTPFILSAATLFEKSPKRLERAYLLGNLAIFAVTISIALSVFFIKEFPLSLRYPVIVVPLLVIVSFRGSLGLTTTTNMILSFMAFFQAIYGRTSFLTEDSSFDALAGVQILVATTTLTHLLMTAAVRKRNQVTQALDGKTRELEEVNRQLDAAKLSAIAANDAKSGFLANMSHELRSPLSAVNGYAELLLAKDLQLAEARSYGEVILRSGIHLTELVNQILDLSKIEAGRLEMNLGPVAVREQFHSVRELMENKALEKGLFLTMAFSSRTPEYITTDDLRLRQILINAIGNAIKFTDKGGVAIRVDCVEGESRRYRLHCEIEDTGIGLAEEDRVHLFQAFGQANPSISRIYGGTGLGLDLCRKLARKLRGDYELLHTEKGKGSVFLLQIDAGEVIPDRSALGSSIRGTSPPPLNERSLNLRGLNILLVDDAADNRFLISRYLELSGAKVESADNGRLAIEKIQLQTDCYDVVLMDIEMPEMNGLQAMERLRAERYQGAVIALTGRAMPSEIEECLRAGFDWHIVKPVNRIQLIQSILNLAEGRNRTSI